MARGSLKFEETLWDVLPGATELHPPLFVGHTRIFSREVWWIVRLLSLLGDLDFKSAQFA